MVKQMRDTGLQNREIQDYDTTEEYRITIPQEYRTVVQQRNTRPHYKTTGS